MQLNAVYGRRGLSEQFFSRIERKKHKAVVNLRVFARKNSGYRKHALGRQKIDVGFLKIVADDTDILLYTSGSTGKPKGVRQRITEFELDNAFVFSKWGAEFAKRKLVTTVSQHHIYGFLFGIALPFG